MDNLSMEERIERLERRMENLSYSIEAMKHTQEQLYSNQVKINDVMVKEKTAMSDMKSMLESIYENCKKMDRHIEFIHSVYATLKSPLDFVIDKINLLRGREMMDNRLPNTNRKIEIQKRMIGDIPK